MKRCRSKANQTVRVERVEVKEGGRAIVGNIRSSGRGDDKKRRQPHGPDEKTQ